MPPVSQERLEWIEARLFVLARSLQVAYQHGARMSNSLIHENPHISQAVLSKTLENINTERLTLMIEREAIQNWLKEGDR